MLADFSSNWSTSWTPYHPSSTNYAQTGSMNHWIARCDGGPSQASVDSAFAEAAATGKPVIYCWYGHDREPMSSYITSLQTYLDSSALASGVKFKYATSKEAMQAVMGTTDTTPPTLAVTQGSGTTFNITSNEAVWNNAPYVAARYLTPGGLLKYIHTPATLTVANTWTAQVPATQSFTTTIPPEKYSPVAVSATHSDGSFPPALAIDGNDTTYWDSGVSYGLPQSITVDLGSIQPVPMLTVHFYDLDARTYTYSIDASTDGTNWTPIVTSSTVHGTATHNFDPAISMRYARVNVTAGSASAIAHIFEITLYKTTTTTTVTETGNLQQVGVGALDLSGNSAVASNILTPLADLSITKTAAPASIRLGAGNLTYTLTVTNHGPSTATGAQVTDTLPTGLTLVLATPSQGTGCSGTSTITCSLGNLANGASASVNIVVTPTAENTYVNTSTVSAAETDLFPANNSASVTTTVGNPVVYIVNAVDTEAFNDHPTTPQHVPFDLHNFIKGQSTYIEPLMADSFRNANKDSFGTPFKMTWYVEMDNFINNGVYGDGAPMNYLTLYNTFVSNFTPELTTWGDELAYHHHFWAWNGTSWAQGTYEQQALTGPYDEHNNALDRMILDAGFFPTDFRSGWLTTSNPLQGWIEKWMLADFSSNWSTSWTPYHPSSTNYAQTGRDRKSVV